MKHLSRFIFLISSVILLGIANPAYAQNSKKVKALKAQKTQLQKTLKKSQADLDKTKKDVQKGQKNLHYIGQQLEDRLNHIKNMEGEMDTLDTKITKLREDIVDIDAQLTEKKAKYTRALRYARSFHKVQNPLIFILSAKTITQMYRRARYAGEYANFQHDLGMQIIHKQGQLMEAQNLLLSAKSRMAGILREVMSQRRNLNIQEVQQKKTVANLQQKQKTLSTQVAKQQKELTALNKKIDDLIAYEIEQARKRAEEAARKEAARKKAAEEAARKKQQQSQKSTGTSQSSTSPKNTETARPTSWLTAEDRQLNGSFEQNKGRLPVPITGQYMIGNHFGAYKVAGLSHVTLDNKGTNYVGKPGARARCIFDGEVTAVFQFARTKNVLVRHGSYISVYCNLSSVIVAKGQKVRTRDIIGTISNDGDGNCVLHFQLRKETAKLNPEAWIGR